MSRRREHLLLLVVALLILPGVFWGLPSAVTPQVDAPVPLGSLLLVAEYGKGTLNVVYPLFHQILLLPFYGRLRARFPDGVIGLWFLAFYAVGRFFLSYLRADQIEYGLRQAQWASLVMVLLAVVFSAYLLRKREAAAPVAAPLPSVVETQTPPAPRPPRKRVARPTVEAAPPSSPAAGGSTGTRRPRRPKASPPGP